MPGPVSGDADAGDVWLLARCYSSWPSLFLHFDGAAGDPPRCARSDCRRGWPGHARPCRARRGPINSANGAPGAAQWLTRQTPVPISRHVPCAGLVAGAPKRAEMGRCFEMARAQFELVNPKRGFSPAQPRLGRPRLRRRYGSEGGNGHETRPAGFGCMAAIADIIAIVLAAVVSRRDRQSGDGRRHQRHPHHSGCRSRVAMLIVLASVRAGGYAQRHYLWMSGQSSRVSDYGTGPSSQLLRPDSRHGRRATFRAEPLASSISRAFS